MKYDTRPKDSLLHKARKHSTSLNKRHSLNLLTVDLCSNRSGERRIASPKSQSDLSEPVTKGRNSGIKWGITKDLYPEYRSLQIADSWS